MASNTSTVQVRVDDGVLWIEGDAYPLRNIARVASRYLEINKTAAWRKFALRLFLVLLFAGPFAAIVDGVGPVIFLALLGLVIWRLVAVITKPTVYGLVLGTSGAHVDAVWSLDRREIEYLVQEITKAISHPDVAQLTYVVHQVVEGDVINQYGEHGTGKAEHHGSGNIGSR